MKQVIETYIVRVYRRGERPLDITGLVETIGKAEKESFNSFEDLKAILTAEKGINE